MSAVRRANGLRVGLAIETDSHGGAETMLLELGSELRARGAEVVALGPTGGEGWLTRQFEDRGIPRDLIEFTGSYGLGSVPRIAATIRRRGLDVLHSHDFTMAVCGALGARLAGCRHVITMHGGSYYASAPRRRLALKVAASLSSHFVAVSDALRLTLHETLGIATKDIEVVHNGLSLREVESSAARAGLGVKASDVLVLAIGNLHAVKGHATLLEAVALMANDGSPRPVVAIAGRGPEEQRLRDLAASLAVDDRVSLLGYRSDVGALLREADVFVMPSLSEGLPMAIIEAMLAGKAIVASNVGGIPELLPTPEHGILVPPGNAQALASAIARLSPDPALRARLGEAARSRALEHFTAAAMAEKYVSLYTQ